MRNELSEKPRRATGDPNPNHLLLRYHSSYRLGNLESVPGLGGEGNEAATLVRDRGWKARRLQPTEEEPSHFRQHDPA